jgi:toxin YoeB
MEIIYKDNALEDIKFWKRSGNKLVQNKIYSLIEAIIEDPYKGIGKPEPLKYELNGFWSRHINHEHRIIYKVEDNILYIHSLKGHYE